MHLYIMYYLLSIEKETINILTSNIDINILEDELKETMINYLKTLKIDEKYDELLKIKDGYYIIENIDKNTYTIYLRTNNSVYNKVL